MEYEMNKNIAILFDSGLSVPKESMGKDMYVVPLYIHFKNESYKDTVNNIAGSYG